MGDSRVMLKTGDLVRYYDHPETLGIIREIRYEDTHVYYKVTWLRGQNIKLSNRVWPDLESDDFYYHSELEKIETDEKKV
jgi:hypothetical protein